MVDPFFTRYGSKRECFLILSLTSLEFLGCLFFTWFVIHSINWLGERFTSWNMWRMWWSYSFKCLWLEHIVWVRWATVERVLRLHWIDANEFQYMHLLILLLFHLFYFCIHFCFKWLYMTTRWTSRKPPHIFTVQVKFGTCCMTGQWGQIQNKII